MLHLAARTLPALALSWLLACARSPGPTAAPAKPSPAPAASVAPTRATGSVERDALRVRVREEFLHAWRGYVAHAWGHDELEPVAKKAHDWHAQPLLMTPVDALDTLILLGLDGEADRTRRYLDEQLSFDRDVSVKNFEITIRILGGLLSAHQLSGDPRLLAMADDLGRRLLPAFESPTGMPYMFVNLKTGKVREKVSNPAEIGTLLLEFGTLAKLTGKAIYYDKAKLALVELHRRRSPIGLVGSQIDVETGAWVGKSSHVGGGIDSYYEYLIKAWLLFGDEDCRKMWLEAREALNRWVADDAGGELWYGRVEMITGVRTHTTFGALDAFLPAVLVLDGDLDRARRLQDSAFSMWTAAGIEPEVWDYRAKKVLHAGYPLRPEIVESAWYLWNATSDEKYVAMGKRMFEDIVAHARVDAGYVSIKDVTKRPMEQRDHMPSFFLAETLKYFHLLFSPPGTLDPTKTVFNTEAHPLKRTW